MSESQLHLNLKNQAKQILIQKGFKEDEILLGFEKEVILCICGCGQLRLRFDSLGRERTYIVGHRNRFKKGIHYSPFTEFKIGHKLNNESEKNRRFNISKGRKGMKFIKNYVKQKSAERKQIENVFQ